MVSVIVSTRVGGRWSVQLGLMSAMVVSSRFAAFLGLGLEHS